MGSGYLRPDQFLDHLTVIINIVKVVCFVRIDQVVHLVHVVLAVQVGHVVRVVHAARIRKKLQDW